MYALVMKVLAKFIAAFFAEAALTEFLLMLGEKVVKSTKDTRDDKWFEKYARAVRNDDQPET